MKLTRTFILCATGCLVVGGAASTFKGRILDKTGEPLPGVTVTAFSLPDSVRRLGVMSEVDGSYELPDLPKGYYQLVYDMPGMKPAVRIEQATDSLDTLSIDDIVLSDDAVMLQEAVVKGTKAAVVARQDTLEYVADSFRTGTNSTVNDLIKKLPGVEVGSDGTITSGGKTVTKILVDGKEFFGDDTQTATKNLPSNMVDKVQVVNRKSDLAQLTGVDDGEDETVINLTVKKDMKNGWFGNTMLGYGTDNRYTGSFVVNRFLNGNQITFIGGGNNINELGFMDRGRDRFNGFGGNSGITNSQRLGVNFNIGKTDSLRFGGNVMYSHTDRKAEQESHTQFLFPDSVSWQNSRSDARDRGHNLNADFRLQWIIDPANTIDFRPRFSYSHRDSEKADTSFLRAGDPMMTAVNHNENNRRDRGDSYEITGDLIFNHNVLSHPGRSFSVQAKYAFSNTQEYAMSWNRIIYYLNHDEDADLYQYLDNHQWSNTVEGRFTWTEPLGNAKNGNFLTMAYRASYKFNNADRLTYELDPLGYDGSPGRPADSAPEGATLSSTLSNRFRNNFFNQEVQVGYKRVTSAYNLEAGAMVVGSSSASKNLIDDARNIPTHWVWNVAPYLRMRYKFSPTSSLMLHYRARTTAPSLTQLQPVADVSDPMNIIIGNPDLKPSFAQSVGAHFNRYDNDRQQSLFAALNATYTLNNVASRTVSDPLTGNRTTTYENVDGNLNIFGMGMITQPFPNREWRFNARLMGSYSSVAGFIDGDKNRSGNLTLRPQAGITFTKDVFQMSVSPTYSLQLTTNTLQGRSDRTVHAYGFDADASLTFPFGLEFSTDLSMAATSGYSAGYNSTQWLWNAELSYSFLRNKSLTAALKAYDILQSRKSIARSVTASSIVDTRTNDLTRYLMFSLTWTFNSFGSKENVPEVEGGDGPPLPPGESSGGNRNAGGPPSGTPPAGGPPM